MTAIEPRLLSIFGFWSGVLILKLILMSILTAKQRIKKKVFSNPEDAVNLKNSKITFDDPDVERVRRAHLNDMENILPWFAMTYIWLGTNPSVWLAGMLIRSFVIARIIHTLVYAIYPKQPYRAISFFMGYLIIVYEAVSTMLYYY